LRRNVLRKTAGLKPATSVFERGCPIHGPMVLGGNIYHTNMILF
jgi:hypothetical protein